MHTLGRLIAAEPAQRHLSRFSAGAAGFFKMPHVALLAASLLSVQGCATLPDAKHGMDASHARQGEFVGTHGAVSAARRGAILDPLKGRGDLSDALEKHLAYSQAINPDPDSRLVPGNKLTLLQNGPATYQAMFAAMRAAKDHINLETFIFGDDESGQRFAELLLERQAAGVQVNIIYDAVGSLATPQAFFDRLRASGIQILEFNPLNPVKKNTKPWLLNNRDHRKLLVVDGHTAFTGGINISDTYSRAPSSRGAKKKPGVGPDPNSGWRDTQIQIEGPVVAEFQKLFMQTWARQKGEPLVAKNYFPEPKARGDEIVGAIGSTADDPLNLIYLTLMSVISHAEQEVQLMIAYFAPDPQLLKALTDAARRGVDVKLILPSYTDSSAVFHLGRSYYTQLLRAGVKIYERQGAVMHAKTACIDGVWSTLGSTNLDWRSFLHNDEINAVILGRGFAMQMKTMFAEDLKHSEAIALHQWQRRSLLLRLQEWTARIGAYWL